MMVIDMLCYFTRHGQTSWNYYGYIQGTTETTLNEKGIVHAKVLATKLNFLKVSEIHSSSLIRTIQTAEIIGKKLKAQVIIDENIHEQDFGQWQGKLLNEIFSKLPTDQLSKCGIPLNPPFGESYQNYRDRILTGIDNIIKKDINKNKLFVVHEGTIKTLLENSVDTNGLEKYCSNIKHEDVFIFKTVINLYKSTDKACLKFIKKI